MGGRGAKKKISEQIPQSEHKNICFHPLLIIILIGLSVAPCPLTPLFVVFECSQNSYIILSFLNSMLK